jgi:hypothetical protein
MIERGGDMNIFTYIEGGYENFSIGFWEGMEICTWNFNYPPPLSSNYFMTGPLIGDSSYRLNFDQGKKNEIQHHG